MGRSKKRRHLGWPLIALAIIIALILATAVALAVAVRQFHDSGKIAPNVSIEGVPVGDMSSPQAMQAVLHQWASKLPTEINLQWPHGAEMASPEKLGARLRIEAAVAEAQQVGRRGGLISQLITRVRLTRTGVDVPVEIEVDNATLEACLIEMAGKVNRRPRNADISVVGERVDVIPGAVGVNLDVPASTKALAEALESPALESFRLLVKTQPPAISAEDLKHLQVVLASYSTRFRSWQKARTHNLRLAIGNLSRAVLAPGDTLSFNERVGPRLLERGFRSAPIFVNGEIEPSTGGGVCQVASTVYNAALLANLDIRERHHHSRPVDYVPSGRDATVYWGQLDLKIRNNLSQPILFLGSINEKTITIQVLGSRADEYEVDIVRSGVSTLAFGAKETPDPELELDKREVEKPGRNGARVTVTRVVKRAGKLIKRERLHTDTYSPRTELVRVGTEPADALLEGLLPGVPSPGAAPDVPHGEPAADPDTPVKPHKPVASAPGSPQNPPDETSAQ